ncbi:Permease of the drug/metabolite transporter (DMT) superfamily [Vibrio xiamenensis]|uniref:Permease of the drug/metabolite transporter (DMT) superfamily n=1 Tax=Vibrio xiamenensis TaxID=861298 RepID=A0A1G7WVT1_9VIBR|nr:DMT family transporter [Vibrio xiamenensis]SDG76045.1 Permease of the drug/metabolite transporter (DMT) superfamily [Vibrio xiamenensis]SDG87293.1 Permease of the drug/metabolite transporter (DMT) superfamily [Vibrio xiamenensis]
MTMISKHKLTQKLAAKAPHLAMVLVTMVWGTTYLLVQHGLTASSPMFFVGCRFAAAAFAIGLISFKHLQHITKQDLCAAVVIGFSMTVGYGAQTIGLQTITSSESAFFTALFVPFVPFILWVAFKKIPHFMSLLGIVLAFIGLIFLSGKQLTALSFNFGQLVTILSAFAVACEIILISHFAPKVNLQRVTALQLLFASMFAFIAMPMLGETSIPPFSTTLVTLTVGLGIASAFIQLVMNWAQRVVEPSTASVIYAAEPVWAGIFGRMAGERLSPLALFGGALVVMSILLSEYRPKRKTARKPIELVDRNP